MPNISIGKDLVFIGAKEAFAGAARVAGYVKEDIRKITGHLPSDMKDGIAANAVIYGTVGHSKALDELEARGKCDLRKIKGRREVYSFTAVSDPLPNVKNALIIAGSDKRGTIYGLFHLSETLGVSPLVNWSCVMPEKRENIVLDESVDFISREPSVKYRGFFINDEYPAFGTWAKEHFGGVNAACYERVFELLLRLKGNYLWPAMWADNFSMDGPGLKSAELADELGVVMSTSHHEPCMRTGEEYSLLRGENSPYGDAWSFVENEEGITRFWEDGLKRNKPFENVITMGMRGERDTAILGKNATLRDNIDLLKKVLKTQNRLIREIINDDLDKVPRQLVLFSEVEEFIYGGGNTEGLLNDPELDGVTLMLSDNNHGMTRTLPTEEMRSHKGGFGMYYHMDMHGGAYSYQWVGSAYLPRVCEQMTMAYEFGVREIWVVNIGDIGTQEHGLSYFLDLAYDIEKWGSVSSTVEYTKEWLYKSFGGIFNEEDMKRLEKAYNDHLILLSRRRHEVMNDRVYHPVHFGEAEDVLEKCRFIMEICEELKEKVPPEMEAAFVSLIRYPLCGTANLMKMWVLAGRNRLFAEQNRLEANVIADELERCFDLDGELTKEYHTVNDGYFYGFGLSEHIGFKVWNDEEYSYPIRMYVRPMNSAAMAVSRAHDEHYMTGRYWTGKDQVWTDFMRPDVSEIYFDIACCGNEPIEYYIETDCEWLSFSSVRGKASVSERICLRIDRALFKGAAEGCFTVKYNSPVQREGGGIACAKVTVKADNCENLPENVFLETDGYVCMEASGYQRIYDSGAGRFAVLSPYGKTGSGIKAYPVTSDFTKIKEKDRPFTEYDFFVNDGGRYIIEFYLAPSTPVTFEPKQYIAFSVNGGEMREINTVKDEGRPFFGSAQWTKEAFDNIKITSSEIQLTAGVNTLRIIAASPAVVYERAVIYKAGCKPPESYLGPPESRINVKKV